MKRLVVRHKTIYRYSVPVTFGPHRLMVRPRDSHDLRLTRATLAVSPTPRMHWVHDVFGNSIAIAEFDMPASTLSIESTLELERYVPAAPAARLDPDATFYPFVYSNNDRIDLGRLAECHYPDPKGRLHDFAHSFVARRPTDTLALLADINTGIKTQIAYTPRYAEGTQPPLETLDRGSGTCRDLALLMIEVVRALGMAARFVSGYLYDPALDRRGDVGIVGSAATHAWVDVYLPGSGWVEYDPTNGLIGSGNLIRVAVTRDPGQALPIAGTFTGLSNAYLGMDVEVSVETLRAGAGKSRAATAKSA